MKKIISRTQTPVSIKGEGKLRSALGRWGTGVASGKLTFDFLSYVLASSTMNAGPLFPWSQYGNH